MILFLTKVLPQLLPQIACKWNTIYLLWDSFVNEMQKFMSPHRMLLTLLILVIAGCMSHTCMHQLVNGLVHHESLCCSVVRAPYHCLGGHGIETRHDTDFFLCPTLATQWTIKLYNFISWLDLLDSLDQIPISLWLQHLWKILFEIKYL